MEHIFHEKQEGSLCAQHCLNSLLQGPYFTPVDLSHIAQRLDEEERQRMAECGEESEEYRRFLQQPSGNMDDSGYFSVQVISSALQVWGLELVPYSSSDERLRGALTDPSTMKAFICNYKDHWFTIRRIGRTWFNLNSLLANPKPISDTYLSLFLAQLKNDGYSIFVVFGDFPESKADEYFKDKVITRAPVSYPAQRSESDSDLETALQLSLLEQQATSSAPFKESRGSDDSELEEAVRLSLQVNSNQTLKTLNVQPVSTNETPEEDEDTLLRKAIDMSLQC